MTGNLILSRERGRKTMERLKELWHDPLTQWVIRTIYYTSILLGLIILYGFAAAHTGSFIYNEF